jgi:hypothetical protein
VARKTVKPAVEIFDHRRRELLANIERERHKKRLQALNEQFEAVKDHLTRISEANEEYFKRRMALAVDKDTVQHGFRDALKRETKTNPASLKTKPPKKRR